MSIAEKLTTVAENIPKVYDQGYEDGKNSVVDFARYMRGGTFKTLNMFKEPIAELNLDSWEDSFLNFFNISTLENANTTVEHLTINCSNLPKSIQQMFYAGINVARDYKLKRLTLNIDTQDCTQASYAFAGLRAVEIIDGLPLNFSNATTCATTFNGVAGLVECRFVANSIKVNIAIKNSPNLSTETIQSIIDGLADLTDTDTQTLTLHADVGAKLTDEQKATITAKNWTLAY